MDEPDWAKILQYIHNHNGEIRCVAESKGDSDESPSHEEHENRLYQKIRDNINLRNDSREGITETHKHLQNTGLAKYQTRSDFAALKLTTDGFEVAHERELSTEGNRINRSLVFFTFVLVIVQIVDTMPAGDLLKSFGLIISLVGMLVVMYLTDTPKLY